MPWVAGLGMTAVFCLVVYLTAVVCPKCGRRWIVYWPGYPALWRCLACKTRGEEPLENKPLLLQLAKWLQHIKEAIDDLGELRCGANE